jgi:hypothetical protein
MGLQRNGRNQKRDEDDTRRMEKRRRRHEKDRVEYTRKIGFYDGIWRTEVWKEKDTIILVTILSLKTNPKIS